MQNYQKIRNIGNSLNGLFLII